MFLLPLEEHGLVYNDVQNPHSPYGFTDTIGKTGTLYMESLLYWRACRMMERMCKTYGIKNPDRFAKAAESVERSLSLLFDPAAGAFYAATKDCHQYDIWGMAYMLYIGFPCSADEKQAVLSFLEKNYDACVYRGQVRHLLKGQYWERLLIDVEPETYQNGAYWATASGWMIWCLAQQNPALAVRALEDVVSCFKTDGSFECINEGYEKLPLSSSAQPTSAEASNARFRISLNLVPERLTKPAAPAFQKPDHPAKRFLSYRSRIFFAIKKLSCDPFFITGQLFFFYS